ncbi:major histocompatibility complex class I-related gene protein-like [Mugil cephalus]|uniref:major histocompatibility complex class I-related gene protein-like n=1 Tax=Mugil cephalus TaxID=48193 RepID=UPI001FB585A5|nr:major histocompatibility complex class I-related gene protein-like [Mugil cephalus]
MKTLFLLLLFCRVSSTGKIVKHSLKIFISGLSGVSDLPELVLIASVDGIQTLYCDGINKKLEPKLDWQKKVFQNDPDQLKMYTQFCFVVYPDRFKSEISSLKQDFNQSEGVHILQLIYGCEWDEETGEVAGIVQYGYNGEDFMALDLKTLTWVALKPQAISTKVKWDSEIDRKKSNKYFYTQTCPKWLKMYLDYGRSSLLRTDVPSVSLLQKTPSSPVSCHATGFYPDRALMFWRKDGEEIHEGVEHGEILPNHDGSFQMNVDLNISSVSPEDWRRCDCVFHLSGVEDDIIIKLDETQIRTNWVEKSSNQTTTIISAVVVVVVVFAAAAGFMVHKKKQGSWSWGQQLQQGSPDGPLPGHFHWLLRRNPQPLPGQTGDDIPQFCSGNPKASVWSTPPQNASGDMVISLLQIHKTHVDWLDKLPSPLLYPCEGNKLVHGSMPGTKSEECDPTVVGTHPLVPFLKDGSGSSTTGELFHYLDDFC